MRRTPLRAAAVAVLALSTAGFASSVASASPGSSARPDHSQVHFGLHHAGHHASTLADGYNIDGGNWSGYAGTGSGFSSVTSTWTEPAVSCNSTDDLFAPWVGIDGYGTSTVEQTGVATDCSSGSPEYAGWYEMYPAAPVYYSNPVAAGDSITATVTRSGTSYTLTLTDNTQGWSKTTNKSLSASNATAEVIIESPTGAYPDFGQVDFSGSTVDGSPLSSIGPDALDASNSGGYEDHTGALSGGDFTISYLRE